MSGQAKITVFYDGACPRCRADRRRYERLAGSSSGSVYWFDITDQDAALRKKGIDPEDALQELHVEDAGGRIHRELDAYILLISRVPLLRPLAWLIGLPGLKGLLSRWYRASVRRRLQKDGRYPD